MLDEIIMVIGGNSLQAPAVEILNLQYDDGICSQPANFDSEINFADGAVAAYINDMVLLCGGQILLDKCLGYDFDQQTWNQLYFSLLEERIEGAGLVWDYNNWMIIGGKSESGIATSTTEKYNNTENEFVIGPLWPIALWGHCTVVINATAGFIVGGKNSEMFVRSSYVMIWQTGYWLWVGSLNYDRIGHTCGVIKHESFNEIVIAGGIDQFTIEVFSLTKMKWRVLKTVLPHRMNSASAISYGNSFVIIGGGHFGTCPIKASECHSSKYIYTFNKESYDLEIRSSTMRTNRGNHLVVSLPRNDMCSKFCSGCQGKKYKHLIHYLLKFSLHCFIVNGGWSLWSMTSECSASCGGGTKSGIRFCNNPTPNNGGKICQGDNETNSIQCGNGVCPG